MYVDIRQIVCLPHRFLLNNSEQIYTPNGCTLLIIIYVCANAKAPQFRANFHINAKLIVTSAGEQRRARAKKIFSNSNSCRIYRFRRTKLGWSSHRAIFAIISHSKKKIVIRKMRRCHWTMARGCCYVIVHKRPCWKLLMLILCVTTAQAGNRYFFPSKARLK